MMVDEQKAQETVPEIEQVAVPGVPFWCSSVHSAMGTGGWMSSAMSQGGGTGVPAWISAMAGRNPIGTHSLHLRVWTGSGSSGGDDYSYSCAGMDPWHGSLSPSTLIVSGTSVRYLYADDESGYYLYAGLNGGSATTLHIWAGGIYCPLYYLNTVSNIRRFRSSRNHSMVDYFFDRPHNSTFTVQLAQY